MVLQMLIDASRKTNLKLYLAKMEYLSLYFYAYDNSNNDVANILERQSYWSWSVELCQKGIFPLPETVHH